MNRDTKKLVVGALLDGMQRHLEAFRLTSLKRKTFAGTSHGPKLLSQSVPVRNPTGDPFRLQVGVILGSLHPSRFSRLAIILVSVLQHHNADQLTQRIVVFLLNSMACHVEGDQKLQIGGYGAIEMILEQIKRKLASNTCDDVMEVGWSFLWNITDETPPNCSRFLDAEGLILFQKCYNTFHGEK